MTGGDLTRSGGDAAFSWRCSYPVDDGVAADLVVPTALVRGEENLYLDNHFTVRVGGELTRRPAHLNAGNALWPRELAGAGWP